LNKKKSWCPSWPPAFSKEATPAAEAFKAQRSIKERRKSEEDFSSSLCQKIKKTPLQIGRIGEGT
jgi:hypothetical protein